MKNSPLLLPRSAAMSTPSSAAVNETREQRIEAILKQLRPKIEQTVRQMVERAVDVPELLGLRDIDSAFHRLADGLLDLGSQLRHDGFDALFARFVESGRGRRRGHGSTPSRKEGSNSLPPSSVPCRRSD